MMQLIPFSPSSKNALWMAHCTSMLEKKRVPKSKFQNKSWEKCNKSELILKRWMYSWMKSSCETREEYLVSKLLFKKFLNSKQIKTKLGTTFIQNVENFVTKHIEPHETYFCFYLRLNLRSFEEYTNSIHEGTNRGLKYNSAPVGPSTNIEKALAIMCNNAERSVTKKKKIASKD